MKNWKLLLVFGLIAVLFVFAGCIAGTTTPEETPTATATPAPTTPTATPTPAFTLNAPTITDEGAMADGYVNKAEKAAGVTIKGTAAEGSYVSVYVELIGKGAKAPVAVVENIPLTQSQWSATIKADAWSTDGRYKVYAVAKKDGVESDPSTPVYVTVDTVAPSVKAAEIYAFQRGGYLKTTYGAAFDSAWRTAHGLASNPNTWDPDANSENGWMRTNHTYCTGLTITLIGSNGVRDLEDGIYDIQYISATTTDSTKVIVTKRGVGASGNYTMPSGDVLHIYDIPGLKIDISNNYRCGSFTLRTRKEIRGWTRAQFSEEVEEVMPTNTWKWYLGIGDESTAPAADEGDVFAHAWPSVDVYSGFHTNTTYYARWMEYNTNGTFNGVVKDHFVRVAIPGAYVKDRAGNIPEGTFIFTDALKVKAAASFPTSPSDIK